MSSHQLDIIPSYQIDKKKWDDCIYRSSNGLIYGYSYYLDALADNWHGIVVNDYECVMPVPWRKKMGIQYCYDVSFIQQLGYFNTTQNIDHNALLDILFKFIKYGHYNFNYNNTAIAFLQKIKTTTNFIIELTDKETIVNNFTGSFRQSLQKAKGNDLTYLTASQNEAIEMYRNVFKNDLDSISEADYKNLLQLTKILALEDKCIARKIINKDGTAVSIVLLLKDDKRLYNIINATIEEGRKTESNYLLYSQLFFEFAGKGLLFDLEGSELPGVKSFYKKMGATDQPYYRIHINKLPFPLNLIKR